MSLGTGPFGTTGLGAPIATLPSADRTTLSSSRKIDAETMTYVENDDGGFEAMSDTLQRVLLLVAFEVREPPVIDDRFEATMQARIRKALDPLTRGPEPTIRINRIVVSNDGKSGTSKTIEFYDFKSDTTQTAQAN